MSKVQSFLPFDCSTVTNYKAWAMGIGNALSELGWSKTSDEGQVDWANVTALPGAANTVDAISSYNLSAWSGGTAYTFSNLPTGNSVVTSAGLTYYCAVNTQYNGLTNVVLGANSSTASTGVTVSGSLVTYAAAVAGASTGSLIGQVFTASGGSNNANNVAYAICVSNTNAAVVLQFAGGQAQASGTYPTLTTSSANFAVGYSTSSATAANWVSNALAGQSVITAGFTGNTNADGTFTVLASAYDASAGDWVGMAYSSAPTTGSGYSGTLTMNTAPASDIYSLTTGLGHWVPYNYEVWQSNDSLSGTNPIFIRFLYLTYEASTPCPAIYFQVGSASSGYGYLTGNVINGGLEIIYNAQQTAQGSSTFECDFSQYQGSFGMFLWRNGVNSSDPLFLAIDRAKDNYGNDLDLFEEVFFTNVIPSSIAGRAGSQILFNPSVGYSMPLLNGTYGAGSWSVVGFAGAATTAFNGNVAAFPVFPIVGYVAIPCLQGVVMLQGDVNNGALINTVLYGAEHTYLMGYTLAIINNADYDNAVGLRWD